MGSTLNMVGGGGGGIKLESIAITTPPNKTQYLAGETFNPAGMVVTASYSNGATLVATGYSYTPDGPLTDGVTSVTITYTEGGISKSATQPITVIPALVSIAVTTPPTTTIYEYGDAFSASGMVVTATMSDNSTKAVTGYTTSPAMFTALGSQNVTISYSENGITKTTTQPVTVERATIAVPTQSGSLTYNGAAQSPSWSGYDSSKMTLGGDTVGTNAGTYNATFTPTAYYRWPDGTTSAKTVQWSIAKAAGYLSISPTSLTLDSSNMTRTISVTRYGDGTISAESNNTGVATVSVSGTTVTVTGTGTAGEATITVSVAASTNYTAPADVTCSVSASYIDPILNNNSWDTIGAASTDGTAASLWEVGDCKQVTLNGTVGALSLSNFSTYAFIIGFNHNSSREGSNKIHFQLAKTALSGGTDICFTDSSYNSSGSSAAFRMNTSNTNSGGWEDSYMRNSICGTSKTSTSGRFMGAIPSALRNALKSVTKYTDNTGNASTSLSAVTATTDYIFLLSEYEVFGSCSIANSNEASRQQQYAYYSAGNSKVKYRHTSTSSTAYWWLRSANRYSSSSFAFVDTSGSVYSDGARRSLGVTPGFCV